MFLQRYHSIITLLVGRQSQVTQSVTTPAHTCTNLLKEEPFLMSKAHSIKSSRHIGHKKLGPPVDNSKDTTQPFVGKSSISTNIGKLIIRMIWWTWVGRSWKVRRIYTLPLCVEYRDKLYKIVFEDGKVKLIRECGFRLKQVTMA